MAHFGKDAGAALVFAILYFCMWCYMLFMYVTKRYKWKSRFSILFFHTTIRVASQACGVAFGVLVWSNVDVFVAYLILGAEGYFSLTIASYYFLKHYEIKHFGSSILGPKSYDGEGRKRRTLEVLAYMPIFMPWRYWKNDLLAVVDCWLIPANAIIIAGGSMMVGAQQNDNGRSQAWINNRLNTAKGLRTAGQAVFLLLTILFGLLLIRLARRCRSKGMALTAVGFYAIVATMLHVRGIFGVLQAGVYSLSYYNVNNYQGDGFTNRFIAIEYCLGVMPEFVAAFLLNMSYWPTRNEPDYTDVELNESRGVKNTPPRTDDPAYKV